MAKVLERSQDLHEKDLLAWLEQRARIDDLLEQSPSLRNGLEQVAQQAFVVAARRAAIETGLKRSAFPAALPYGLAAMLEDEPDSVGAD
ncbi:MAG TPA: DUF29 family protein [Geminicoccaceae bacterium]|nr:DUF29 family protein [Geminicoccaceae bacterium]